MPTEQVTAVFHGEQFDLRANWASASAQVERLTADGWETTGMQVADHRHSPRDAMDYEITLFCRVCGADPDDQAEQIKAALVNIE